MANKNWIQGAIKHPGAFTQKAKEHDMGTQMFADYVLDHKGKFSGTTVKQAQLDKTLVGMNHKRKEG